MVSSNSGQVLLTGIASAERAARVMQKTKRDKGVALAASLEIDATLLAALKNWRLERSRTDKVPAFVILHDSTLEHLCLRKPTSLPLLRAVPGIGETKLERYGKEILEVLHAR